MWKMFEIKNFGIKILEYILLIILMYLTSILDSTLLFSIVWVIWFIYCLEFDNKILDSKVF